MRMQDMLGVKPNENGHTPSPDGFYWHVTSVDRVAKIRREGLRTGRKRRWSNHFGARLGNGIYFTSLFHSAIGWGAKMQYDFGLDGKIVLLKVTEPQGLVPDDDLASQMAGNTHWRTSVDVPPEHIVRVVPLTLPLIQDYVAFVNGRGPVVQEP